MKPPLPPPHDLAIDDGSDPAPAPTTPWWWRSAPVPPLIFTSTSVHCQFGKPSFPRSIIARAMWRLGNKALTVLTGTWLCHMQTQASTIQNLGALVWHMPMVMVLGLPSPRPNGSLPNPRPAWSLGFSPKPKAQLGPWVFPKPRPTLVLGFL